MEFEIVANITEDFKTLIQSGNYEKLILDLMNVSAKVFPNKYMRNEEQSKGECDFIEYLNENSEEKPKKFEAKLPFDKNDGKNICSKKSDYIKWLEHMIQEEHEFAECIKARSTNVRKLSLYEIMLERLNTVEKDENAIFFFPFPISMDYEGGIFGQFASDILSAVYSNMEEDNHVKGRNVYAIYPSIDGKIVLRNLNNGCREFIPKDILDQYIIYDVTIKNEIKK